MPGLPWSKFFWRDYESDEAVKQCSFAAQGLWMRLLCLCAKGDPYGYLSIAGVALDVAGVSTAVGRPETEIAPLIAELDRWGVFSRDRRGRIYCRRMVRAEQASNRGRKYANKRWLQVSENIDEKSIPNGVANGPPMAQKPEARVVEAGSKTEPSSETTEPSKTAQAPQLYAFVGKVVRLTSKHFGELQKTYHAIPDLAAYAATLDAYYDENLKDEERKRWFIRFCAALDKKHQELLAKEAKEKARAARPLEERYPNEGMYGGSGKLADNGYTGKPMGPPVPSVA